MWLAKLASLSAQLANISLTARSGAKGVLQRQCKAAKLLQVAAEALGVRASPTLGAQNFPYHSVFEHHNNSAQAGLPPCTCCRHRLLAHPQIVAPSTYSFTIMNSKPHSLLIRQGRVRQHDQLRFAGVGACGAVGQARGGVRALRTGSRLPKRTMPVCSRQCAAGSAQQALRSRPALIGGAERLRGPGTA